MFPAYLSKPTAKTNGLRSNHRLLQVQVIQCEGFKVRSYNVFSHASVYVSLQFSEMGSHCRCPPQFDCLCSRGEEDDRLGVTVRERAVQDRPKLFHKGRGAAPSLGAPHIPQSDTFHREDALNCPKNTKKTFLQEALQFSSYCTGLHQPACI